jgi:hypothetical protein
MRSVHPESGKSYTEKYRGRFNETVPAARVDESVSTASAMDNAIDASARPSEYLRACRPPHTPSRAQNTLRQIALDALATVFRV